MLIRVLIKNLYSFNELTEFNMLPGRSNRLSNHVIQHEEIDVLKLNAIYGANGAGKSNLIHALDSLKKFLVKGELPVQFLTETFKFTENSNINDVYLGVEFLKDGLPFYYGITINQGIVIEEELQISGLGKKEDQILFKRTDSIDHDEMHVEFNKSILDDPENSQFPAFLVHELLQRNQPVLYYMKNRQSQVFSKYKMAFEWFESELIIIRPDSKPSGLPALLDTKIFKDFALETMHAFNTGIEVIEVESMPAEEYFGKDDKVAIDILASELKARSLQWLMVSNDAPDVLFTFDTNKPVVKRVVFYHKVNGGNAKFLLSQESDGTKRLFEYIPILFSLINYSATILIDEIERSIHPLLIKELIKKFSLDPKTKGQLIFSTHESNLLDQEIFRPDEIWFVEKNKDGATELYPLSDFKEHHTIDIRKGYLNGRYGAIPFLGNLQDLNWDKYAETN